MKNYNTIIEKTYNLVKYCFLFLILSLFYACSNPAETKAEKIVAKPPVKSYCNYITDYYPHSIKAEIAYYEKDYQTAYIEYRKAFKTCESLDLSIYQNDTYKFAAVCAALGKNDEAFAYIKKRIQRGAWISEFKRDSAIRKLLKTKRGEILVTEFEERRAEYLATINVPLRNEIQVMLDSSRAYFKTDSYDSIVQKYENRLVEIIERQGYPNNSIIGARNVDQKFVEPSMLLLQTTDSIRNYYFIPKLKRYVKNGSCPPTMLGIMYDEQSIRNEQYQMYGTFKDENGIYPHLIEDIKKVDSNRISIGLPTLAMQEKLDSLKHRHY